MIDEYTPKAEAFINAIKEILEKKTVARRVFRDGEARGAKGEVKLPDTK